jgi:hypothetical protein
MAAIRKSNLRGKKRWLGRDTTNKETILGGSKFISDTSLPPLPKSPPSFLNRQRRYSTDFFDKNDSSVYSKTSPSTRVKPQRINNKNRTSKNPIAIPVMPDGSKVPMLLMRWNSFHRHTSVATFLLVSTTLIVYGLTVYSQHLWSSSYKKLQELQRDERQLTKTDETLKNQMAQEGEKPHSGLVSPTPANTIFLEETPPSRSQQVDKDFSETLEQPSNALGY